MDDLNELLIYLLLLGIVWLAAPPVVAAHKGYPTSPWWLGGGLIGVFVLAFFPVVSLKAEGERDRLIRKAEKWGNRLSSIQAMLFVGWLIISYRR